VRALARDRFSGRGKMADIAAVQLALDWQCTVATPDLPADAEARLMQIIRATLAQVGLSGMFGVSLVITDDRRMQRINRQFRGIDAPTDVLSFPQSDVPLIPLAPDVAWVARPFGDDTHHATAPLALPAPALPAAESPGALAVPASIPYDANGMMLGDIMIAASTVARQATAAGHGAWWEMCFLVAHGTLHLVGYDDYYEPGYRAMVALQEAVLATCGIWRDTH
jgi:probable rRNA maturation factor